MSNIIQFPTQPRKVTVSEEWDWEVWVAPELLDETQRIEEESQRILDQAILIEEQSQSLLDMLREVTERLDPPLDND